MSDVNLIITDRDGKTQSTHHKYLSGYYLITKLRHHFTKEKYEIEFEAIKDSLKVSAKSEAAEAASPRDTSGSRQGRERDF